MPDEDGQPITRVLLEAAGGDPKAARDLLPLVYEELRALARARLKKIPPGQTLQATALVHEAYLRLLRREDPGWDHRGHFFAAAARAMRDILVEQARRKMAVKHGGDRVRLSTDEVELAVEPPSEDVLAVDEAISRLEQLDPRKGEVVNLRFFARLTTAETAVALGVSVGTVERDWRFVRAWLQRELAVEPGPPEQD